MAPFKARGTRLRTRSDGRKDIATLVSNGHPEGQRCLFTNDDSSIQTKYKNKNKKCKLFSLRTMALEIISNCRNSRRSHVNVRRVALGARRFARTRVAVTTAPRNSRGPEGLLLGTPPLPIAEGTRLRDMKQSSMAKRSPNPKETGLKAQRRTGEKTQASPTNGRRRTKRLGEDVCCEAVPRPAKTSAGPAKALAAKRHGARRVQCQEIVRCIESSCKSTAICRLL